MTTKIKALSCVSVLACCTAFAFAAGAQEQGPAPVRTDEEKMAGLDLTPVDGGAYEDILVEGELKFRVATLLAGKVLRVTCFESTPSNTDHRTRTFDIN